MIVSWPIEAGRCCFVDKPMQKSHRKSHNDLFFAFFSEFSVPKAMHIQIHVVSASSHVVSSCFWSNGAKHSPSSLSWYGNNAVWGCLTGLSFFSDRHLRLKVFLDGVGQIWKDDTVAQIHETFWKSSGFWIVNFGGVNLKRSPENDTRRNFGIQKI